MGILFWVLVVFIFLWGIYWSLPHDKNTYLKKINWGKLGIYVILLVGFAVITSYLSQMKKDIKRIHKGMDNGNVIYYMPFEEND